MIMTRNARGNCQCKLWLIQHKISDCCILCFQMQFHLHGDFLKMSDVKGVFSFFWHRGATKIILGLLILSEIHDVNLVLPRPFRVLSLVTSFFWCEWWVKVDIFPKSVIPNAVFFLWSWVMLEPILGINERETDHLTVIYVTGSTGSTTNQRTKKPITDKHTSNVTLQTPTTTSSEGFTCQRVLDHQQCLRHLTIHLSYLEDGSDDASLVKHENSIQASLQPTIVSYGSMLSAFEEVGKWQLALALFQHLPTVTLQPSVAWCGEVFLFGTGWCVFVVVAQ